MSAIEKFVLEYRVDSKSAESDLEKLQAKIKATGANSDTAANDVSFLGEALKKAKEHTGGLSSTLDGALGKLTKLAPTALAASAALGAIAYTMKAVNDAMKEYSAQRDIAFKAGTGVQQIEQFQRGISSASKGRVGSESARDIYGKVAEIGAAAYQDPMQNNREARLLRQAGGSVNGADGRIQTTEANIESISQAFAALDSSTAQARGALLGFTQDQVNGLRAMASASAQSKQMSDGETAAHAQATEAALRLQGANSEIAESFRQTGNTIADMALPALAGFEEHIARIAKVLPETFEWLGAKLDWLDRFVGNVQGDLDGKKAGMSISDAAKAATEGQKTAAKEAREVQKKSNEASRAAITQTNRDINIFSQAVATFASTIDQNEALSAWAGEIGRARGLGSKDGVKLGDGPRGTAPTSDSAALQSVTGEPATSSGNRVSRGIRNNNPGNLEYGPFAKALGATGSDGRFATFPTMAAGVAAHERLLQNYMRDGFDTVTKIVSKYAPPSENDTAGYIKSVANELGIDANAKVPADKTRALLSAMEKRESGYRGEGVSPRLQPQGDDYAASAVQLYAQNPNAAPIYRSFEPTGMFFRKDNGQGIGRQQVQADASAAELAAALKVPVDQLRRGGVSRGDVAYAESNLYAQHVQSMMAADQKLKAPGLTPLMKQELYEQRGTAAARIRDDQNFFGDIAGRAADGPRTALTIGTMPIYITGEQAQDPAAVQRVLKEALRGTVNTLSSDRKL